METYWWYIFKVNISLSVFYLFYCLFLKNYTFFLINRIYLISTILLSFFLPLMEFSIFKSSSVNVLSTIVDLSFSEPASFFETQKQISNAVNINFSLILSVIYFTVILFLFFKVLFSIIRVLRTYKNAENYMIGNKKVVKLETNFPFSFFNIIFLPSGDCNPMIIEHELAHIRQKHWFDLIIIEITTMTFWFNPFVFLYKSALKLQHEYLADKSVLNSNYHVSSYLKCMLQQVQVNSFGGLISQFYFKTIKNRVIMISKNKTSIKNIGIYFLVIPLISILLFAFTGKATGLNSDKEINSIDYIPSLCPVDITKVKTVNGYGERTNPFTKKKDFHRGIDFSINEGESILAPANGTVVESSFDEKLGNYLLIRHNNEFSTFYAHFKSSKVKVGDEVVKGQVIAITGNTGTLSTGAHLHYEVIKNNERENPKNYMP